MDKLEKLWNDTHKAKGTVSSYIRRAKIINPIVYGIYSVLCLGYLIFVFYDLFVAQNIVPNWLPFGWLHTLINLLPYPLLISSLLLVAVPVLLGVLLKMLVHFSKDIEIPQMPEEPYLIRKSILTILDENTAARKTIKNPLFLSITLSIIAVVFAVIYGIQTNQWRKSAFNALICIAMFFVSYYAVAYVGMEKGGSVKKEITYRAAINEKKFKMDGIVSFCVSLLKKEEFAEAAKVAEESDYARDTRLLEIMAKGMNDPKSAAKAIAEIRGRYTFDYPEVDEITKQLKPRLMEKAKIHYTESEKEADLCIANKNWVGVRAALADSYMSSGDCRIKYTYAVLIDDPTLSFDDVKWYANCLDLAEYEGFSSECEYMLFVCRREISKWAAAYNVVFTKKTASAARDTSTKHMSILDARAKLKRIIEDPNLSSAEKEAAVKAHNNEHLDHISIKNGRYYNFSEE